MSDLTATPAGQLLMSMSQWEYRTCIKHERVPPTRQIASISRAFKRYGIRRDLSMNLTSRNERAAQ